MYQTIEFSTSYVNEPENIYYSRKPAPRRYMPGNSYNTYCMVKEAIAFRQGYWLMILVHWHILKSWAMIWKALVI
ncbi:hypothetical protein SAMN04488524_0433 [Pedobacter africanus]|uniref:Uncharacterized protein n=1 Tax=Pedobacter africanus TaxID=151894 RepID=A0A1W1Z7Y5_9SPHI|nr:hypothetical protein SAMN04488524_0433 [Pedobacter africanus]